MKEKRILYLTLNKKWFDMIRSGVKTEEYREIKPYWETRLSKEYDLIHFTNGYRPDYPRFLIEFNGLRKGVGKPEWGAEGKVTFILSLGNIVG